MATILKSSRLDMRMTEDQKSQIEMAAAIKGKKITQWALDNLMAAAHRDISEETTTELSSKAFEAFVSAIDAGMPKEAKRLLDSKPVWQ